MMADNMRIAQDKRRKYYMENDRAEDINVSDKSSDVDGIFVPGEGFKMFGEIIAPFEPYIKCKYIKKNLTTKRSEVSYDIVVRAMDGSEKSPVRISEFEKIDWLMDFGVDDSGIKKLQRKRLVYKLRQEAAGEDIPTCKELIADSGFYIVDDVPVMVMGDRVIVPRSKANEVRVKSVSKTRMKSNAIPDMNLSIKTYLDFMPEVSPILFYASLLGAVKPILNKWSVLTDFIVMIVGPSGHLKTTLARYYAQWLESESDQKIGFDETIRNDALESKMKAVATQNFVIDDFRPKALNYDNKKFESKLDILTRIVSAPGNIASAVVTAETLEESKDNLLFSCLDRFLRIEIDKQDGETLRKLKLHLKDLSGYEMSEIAFQFVTKIIDDYEGAKIQADNFRETYKPDKWCDALTRVSNQIMVISLVEHLFCHYMCNDDKEKSGHDKLLKLLEKNGRSQTDILRQKQRNEQVNPAIITLYEMIEEGEECAELKIVKEKSKYNEESGTAAYRDTNLEHDFLYITKNSLQRAFTKRGGKIVSMKKLSDEFHDAGILVEDIDKRTKKFLAKRHYVINVRTLREIVNILEGGICE
jgi:hypothetical protein